VDLSDDESPDRGALRRAFEQHDLRLVRLATLLSGSESVAEDLVQDVYVRAASKVAELADAEVFPYLHRSVVNAWKNYVRHRKVEERASLADEGAGPSPDDSIVLWAEIEELPPRQRACIVLRYYEDLDDREIADLLGCRVGTVRSQISRAVAKLKKVVA
jgi:RNA polymerase sigma factor (sigma-70 family)